MKKTVIIETKKFSDDDTLELGVEIESGQGPYYFVTFNTERIGPRLEKFGTVEARFNHIKRVIQIIDKVNYCELCDDYVTDVIEYYLTDDKTWTEKLCPSCYLKEQRIYKSITEVTSK